MSRTIASNYDFESSSNEINPVTPVAYPDVQHGRGFVLLVAYFAQVFQDFSSIFAYCGERGLPPPRLGYATGHYTRSLTHALGGVTCSK